VNILTFFLDFFHRAPPFTRLYRAITTFGSGALLSCFCDDQSSFIMSLSIQQVQQRLDSLTSQQECMFTFIEKGLCHLSKQLATISKNNKVNEEVIDHLQAVVRDSFDRINQQEQEIIELNDRQSQIADSLLHACQTLENKTRKIKELEQELFNMREQKDTIALSNMWIYPAEPTPNQLIFPASPCLQPSLAPQWEFDPFYL